MLASRVGPVFGVVVGLALLLVPSTALAADVSTDGFEIDYHASPGETNDVVVDQGAGNVTITESGVGVTLNHADGVGGCEVTGAVATCPDSDVFVLRFTMDDGDDKVRPRFHGDDLQLDRG
jgi:hypothetical protein